MTRALLDSLTALRGSVAKNLLQALQLRERVQARYNRHIIYRQLRFALNTRDGQSFQDAGALEVELARGTAFVRAELVALDSVPLAPALRPYAFVIEQARRYAPYTRAAGEEEILNGAAALTAGLPNRLHQLANSRAEAGRSASSDREAAWQQRYSAREAQRELFALAFIEGVRARNELARMRGYNGAAEQALFDLYLEPENVKTLYAAILDRADLYRAYQQRFQPRPWDPSDPTVAGGRFSIDEASRAVLESLADFPTVRSVMTQLLDPRNGRMDIAPGPNRAPGAFAWGVPGLMTTFFYHSGYQGTYRDLSTFAHEASHAVHGQLLGENPNLTTRDIGPPFLAEGLAMFFELLLNDRMYAREPDPARRAYLLEQFLWRGMLTFNVTRQAALEHAIYEGVAANTISSADDLDSVTVRVGREVSDWYTQHPELKNDWNTVQHYFNSPLYVPNYVYASILGLALYQAYVKEPRGFEARLLPLLRDGFVAPPQVLLKRHLGIDLEDPATIAAALRLLEDKLKLR